MSWTDRCGQPRTGACGTCPGGSCNPSGQCQYPDGVEVEVTWTGPEGPDLFVGKDLRDVCDDDGELSLYVNGQRTSLLTGSGLRQRGAVIADLDPSRPGEEIATAGYDRLIRVFLPRGPGFETIAPYRDPERFHHLASGQLDEDAPVEIVGASFSGNLVIVESVPGF